MKGFHCPMMKNECPVCKKTLYSKLEFDKEPLEEIGDEESYQSTILPNWPADEKPRPQPHKDNENRY